MTNGKSPTEKIFEDIVKSAVTGVLKPAGFKKSSLNFHRRQSSVVQVINLQSSRGNTYDEKVFYVNVGLAFDDICHLADEEILERPREFECDSRGIRKRMEETVKTARACWSIDNNCDLAEMTSQLRSSIEYLVNELQNIDSLQAYREHRWFGLFRPNQTNAQILYLLEELDAAWREVRELSVSFGDREFLNRPEWWIEELKLVKLESRCNGLQK